MRPSWYFVPEGYCVYRFREGCQLMLRRKHLRMKTSHSFNSALLILLQSDVKNSATCWIALVQRYNMPNFVVTKGQQVNLENTDVSSTSGQLHGGEGEGGNEQFVVIQEGSNCIDLLTTEHVQCCGHQVIWSHSFKPSESNNLNNINALVTSVARKGLHYIGQLERTMELLKDVR